jgi:hypothetical protein
MTLADELVEAKGYATRLLVALMDKHFQDRSPGWEPLPYLMGVLTQIDNLTTGLTRAAEPDEPFKWVDGISWHKPAHRAVMVSVNLGSWLSAALDDPKVCDAMKADIREWFSAGEPMEILGQALAHRAEPAEPGQVTQVDREAAASWLESWEPGPEMTVVKLARAFAAHRALGIAQGRALERADVVALRETVLNEDWLEETISDSLDMDWHPRDAARLILSRHKDTVDRGDHIGDGK